MEWIFLKKIAYPRETIVEHSTTKKQKSINFFTENSTPHQFFSKIF